MRERDEHAVKAAAILREDQPLAVPEEAAAKVIKDGAWILWHAHDRDMAVARLLHRAGLLRDLAHEQAMQRADVVLREAAERERSAERRLASALSGIVSEALAWLREGKGPGELADRIAAAQQRAQEAYERAKRPPGMDGHRDE